MLQKTQHRDTVSYDTFVGINKTDLDWEIHDDMDIKKKNPKLIQINHIFYIKT